MLISFTDIVAKQPVHINPKHIVAVFTIQDGEFKGSTGVSLANGNLVVEESDSIVVGIINTALTQNGCCN